MERNICKVCEQNYSLYKVPSNSGEARPICVFCLRDKLASGEVKLKGKERIEFINSVQASIKQENSDSQNNLQQSNTNNQQTKQISAPSLLLQFGEDLTKKALDNKIDPLVGREREIENALRILKRRYKNNPIIIGEAGVGKTALVEGIALKIVNGEVNNEFRNKRIISISIASLIAGTKYRGEFEDRINKVVDEVKKDGNVILFIDEVHTIVNGGAGEGNFDVAQLIKPSLSRGELQIIGTSTFDEYRKTIEKDKGLDRRFQKVVLSEPTPSESIGIIRGLKETYEKYHKVLIPDEVIINAVELSKKYLTDRTLPDKAIDLIDEACAHKRLQNPQGEESDTKILEDVYAIEDMMKSTLDFDTLQNLNNQKQELLNSLDDRDKDSITTEDITYVLEQWTGIPANKMTKNELKRLRSFSDEMRLRIKGQDKAITVLSSSIKRNFAGLKDDNRPIGVYMMLGPTGVGKTEMTKALTELLFGDETKMKRLDMGEYMEKHSVSKLIGSPPGYVGYEDEGELTKYIRQNPYSVVLFDEMEKAHPDVSNILLRLFDEGRITNSGGRTVDARNVIFIMTSNAGSDLYSSKKTGLGYSLSQNTVEVDLEKKVRERLKESYKPEFLNRIDDFLVFNKLSKENMLEITERFVEELKLKLTKQGISLNIEQKAIELIAEKGYDPEMGARPLRRKIDEIKTIIADKMVELDEVDILTIDVNNEEFIVK